MLAAALVAAVGVFYLRPWRALTPSPSPSASASARPAVVVQQLQFVSASAGWVMAGGPTAAALFHTTDAGRHWQRQLDGGPDGAWAFSFFDAGRGVVYVAGQRGPELMRTTDAGQHWTRRAMTCQTQPQLVFFLDLDHGWCVAPSGVSPAGPVFFPARQEIALYRTADGGLDWSRVLATGPGQPASGGLGDDGQKSWIWFQDASTGWIGQDTPGGHAVVFATTDAGDHWSRQELPPPDGGWGSILGTLEDSPPDRGSTPSVVVSSLAPGPGQDVYRLAGRYVHTWRAQGWTVPVQVPNGLVTIGGPDRWYVVTGSSLLGSTDQGENWTTLDAPPPGWQLFRLTMVDPDHGWATLSRPDRSAPRISATGLARTADGGRHWALVTPPS